MAKMGFDPSKHSRWPIAFPVPLLPFSTGAFDSPVNCLGVNRRWLNLIILASDVLLDERSWEKPTEDELWYARQQLVLVQEALRRSEDCCEPQPEPVVSVETREDGCKRILLDGVPASDWICPSEPEPGPDHVVGSSGLSYEELESFYMACINIAGLLKFENGKFYAKDDCCNWVLIQGQDAPLVTTQTATGDATASWQGWDNAGKPALPVQPEVKSALDYFTNDSLKCAKATALVDALYSYLDTDKDIAEEAESGGIISDLIALATSAFTGIATWVMTDYVATLKKHIAAMDVPAYASEVEAMLADDDLKSQIICVLADRVTAPGNIGLLKFNRVTDADIDALITTFIEVAEPSSDFELRTKAVLVYWLATETTANLDATECGCEDLLPHGYVPPLPAGAFQFTLQRMYRAFNPSTGAYDNPNAGENFAGIDSPSGTQGTINGTGYPVTELVAHSSGDWIHGFGALLELSEPATITAVNLTVVRPEGDSNVSGTGTGTVIEGFSTDDNLWHLLAAVGDTSSPFITAFGATGLSLANVTHIAVAHSVASNDSGGQVTAKAVSILLSGSYGGGETFANLEMGEIHTP